jgi:hypothetical protein
MVKSKKIQIESYGTGLDYTYIGRLIGLVNEDNFIDLIRNKDIQSNLLTSESMDIDILMNIAINNATSITDKRMIIAVNEINGVYSAGKLFATQVLDTCIYVDPKDRTLGFSAIVDGAYLSINEL